MARSPASPPADGPAVPDDDDDDGELSTFSTKRPNFDESEDDVLWVGLSCDFVGRNELELELDPAREPPAREIDDDDGPPCALAIRQATEEREERTGWARCFGGECCRDGR